MHFSSRLLWITSMWKNLKVGRDLRKKERGRSTCRLLQKRPLCWVVGCFCAVKSLFLSNDILLRQCDVVGVHDVLVTIMNIITITVLILSIITMSWGDCCCYAVKPLFSSDDDYVCSWDRTGTGNRGRAWKCKLTYFRSHSHLYTICVRSRFNGRSS